MPFNKLDDSAKEMLSRLCGQQDQKNSGKKDQGGGSDKKNGPFNLTPSQTLVIAGILGGVLSVDSVLVGRGQRVEILLVGSLKSGDGDGNDSSELENMLDQIGNKSFDEVVKAMINRLT